MLEELHVRDLALIEDVWLEFGPGMTALTGETGAGKTALVEALQLLVGERADAGLVRAGAAEAVVEGRFSTDGPDLIAKRRVSAQGRSRCVLGDEMVTVGALEQALGPLVDLHGQHEHQSLLFPSGHALHLDRYAKAESERREYAVAYAAYREALVRAEALAGDAEEARRHLEEAKRIVADIDAVAPAEAEDEVLERRLPAMRNADRLAEILSHARDLLRGDHGAEDGVAEAAASLSRARALDPALDELADRVSESSAVLSELAREVAARAEAAHCDPGDLDAAETRLDALYRLKRAYGPTLSEVIARRAEAAALVSSLSGDASGPEEAARAVGTAKAELDRCGRALIERRRTAVPGFFEDLALAAADLGMPAARFDVLFEDPSPDRWGPEGPGGVEFLFSGSEGEAPRPLAKIASGGEVSRVMLALKGVLGRDGGPGVLVFDEVDAGIGGATAHAVGRRLAALAGQRQVLVVTHLAQVAAYADRQLVVAKEQRDGRSFTTVRAVEGLERVSEIARMLSGGDSEAVMVHARELLDGAQRASGR